MKLIAGLGNYGAEYEGTRHNMGFEVVEELAKDLDLQFDRNDFKGAFCKGQAYGQDVILLKPLTYMNLSGQSVAPIMKFYKIPIADLIVICDDLAIKPGTWRARSKGSSGGQKGLQNIIDLLGTEDFKRIRIGTGEPAHGTSEVVDYVLGKPSNDDRRFIDKAQDEAVKFLHIFIRDGYQKAMDAISTGIIKEDVRQVDAK